MKKLVLFLILILPVGCTVMSNRHLAQTSQGDKTPTASQQISKQSETEEAKASSGIEAQRILNGRTVHSPSEDRATSSGDERLKLAEPAPKTVRRPWGGIFNVPAGITPPKPETRTENVAAVQEAPASLPEIVSEETQSHVESPSYPEPADDKVKTSSAPKRQPWGSVWRAPLYRASPSIAGETLPQNIETPPPASWEDYKNVDFGKFASGSYTSDYANKYVKIKCRFSRIASEFVEVPKYPRPDYVTFIATGVDSRLYSLNVVVSRADADTVFKLKPQEEIILYGKAVQIDLHTLSMEVRKIER